MGLLYITFTFLVYFVELDVFLTVHHELTVH